MQVIYEVRCEGVMRNVLLFIVPDMLIELCEVPDLHSGFNEFYNKRLSGLLISGRAGLRFSLVPTDNIDNVVYLMSCFKIQSRFQCFTFIRTCSSLILLFQKFFLPFDFDQLY